MLRENECPYNPNKSRVFNVLLERFMGNKLHSFWLHPTNTEMILLGYEHQLQQSHSHLASVAEEHLIHPFLPSSAQVHDFLASTAKVKQLSALPVQIPAQWFT